MSSPPYTPDQLNLYLERIQYPEPTNATRLQHAQESIATNALAALTELQRRHLGAIPWGNSALHYSQHKAISIHPTAVFDKLVHRRLDGYCMENTNLFYGVLRSLGYTVYPTGGRVCEAASGAGRNPGKQKFYALGHMILIVTIEGKKYMTDVGFGNNGPTSPLLLEEDVVSTCIAPSESRLTHDSLPEFVDKTQKVWIYQLRYTPDSEWLPHYAFSEVEFLPQDFDVMNYATSTGRNSWFTQILVCARVILDEETGTQPQGLYVLVGKVVKKRLQGQTEVVATFETEDDRVAGLEKWFGLHFRDDEVEGIQGLVSHII
ncbi:hypothetical protein N8T08_002161 [Aspergillus melleus]|uniref:Uncharacterized protein n=1 Tax=Aspergillus melleus TaxID=138277 RepID=A0ACC3AMU7_9EURO|nr:hypothetical protein N8T08_002161 [Aspergillus melleus]